MATVTEGDEAVYAISLLIRAREKLDANGSFAASALLTHALDVLARSSDTAEPAFPKHAAIPTPDTPPTIKSEPDAGIVERVAACRCGQMHVTCRGEPQRVSVCHCLDCQRRSGSAFTVQARFHQDQVQSTGNAAEKTFVSEAGALSTFRFCPFCGSTVTYVVERMPDVIMVAVGAFANPDFPPPSISIFEERRHPWAFVVAEGAEHFD